ncbi:MAG: sensor histidine kinase [Alcaligenaceae bacterium]
MIDPIQHAHGAIALMTAVSVSCVSALVLHHVCMYFVLRDKNFLLFTALALVTCLATFVANDFTTLSLWLRWIRWDQSALLEILCLGVAVNLIFSRRFLNTRQLVPKIDAAMRLLVGFFIALIFLLLLSVYFLAVSPWFVKTVLLLVLISTSLILYATVQVIRAGHKEAHCFFLAQSLIWLELCVSALSHFGWLLMQSLSSDNAQLSLGFEMLFFSLALSARIHNDRNRGEAALLEVSQAHLVLLESIRETEARLASSILERTQELDILVKNEKTHKEQYVRFGSMISHEFRNPLGIIESQAALLKREDAIGVNNIKKRINAISNATHRLALLFEKWLQHDRLSYAPDSVRVKPIDLSIWMSNLIEKWRVYQENHTLELVLSPEAQHIWADEQLLHVLLLNLIDNACKYSPIESKVRIETRDRSGMTGIAVIDQGCGVATQFHKDIFLEYFRVDPESKVRGVGLGLSFVKRIVLLHSGQIELISDVGQGSSFCVWFPQLTPAKPLNAL